MQMNKNVNENISNKLRSLNVGESFLVRKPRNAITALISYLHLKGLKTEECLLIHTTRGVYKGDRIETITNVIKVK